LFNSTQLKKESGFGLQRKFKAGTSLFTSAHYQQFGKIMNKSLQIKITKNIEIN